MPRTSLHSLRKLFADTINWAMDDWGRRDRRYNGNKDHNNIQFKLTLALTWWWQWGTDVYLFLVRGGGRRTATFIAPIKNRDMDGTLAIGDHYLVAAHNN